jgi:hypothetical protein
LTPEQARELAAERLREIRAAKGKSSTMTGLRLTIQELAGRYHEAHADRGTPKTRVVVPQSLGILSVLLRAA